MAFDFEKPRTVAYCDGPNENGVEQSAKFNRRWAAWVSDKGIRAGQYDSVTPPANSLGEASTLYPTTKPSHLSIAFSRESLITYAIQKEPGVIEINRYFDPANQDNNYSLTFNGYSPVLFQSWLLWWGEPGMEDYGIACYYLDGQRPNRIYARFQNENWQVEHIVHDDLPIDIDYLVSSEVFEGNKQVLLAKTTDGSNATLYSAEYGLTVSDHATLSVEFLDGNYVETAVQADAGDDTMTSSVEILQILKNLVEYSDLTAAAHTFTFGIEFIQGSYE